MTVKAVHDGDTSHRSDLGQTRIEPSNMLSSRDAIGGWLGLLGTCGLLLVGSWGFFLNLSLTFEFGGPALAIAAIVLFPAFLLIGPAYFALSNDIWLPFAVVYGGLAASQFLRWLGDELITAETRKP